MITVDNIIFSITLLFCIYYNNYILSLLDIYIPLPR